MLLPMECYTPGVGNGNTCGTGAFGVADPATLAFRYYVKLDPADIPKAMWAETSPDGSLIWTSSGNDLLAYRSSRRHRGESRPLRAADPTRPPPDRRRAADRRHRRRLPARPSAARRRGERRLSRYGRSIPRTGGRRLELEMSICGESEGLDVIPTLGGKLHWLISPFDPGCQLTFGPTSALLHFIPNPAHQRFQVAVTATDVGTLPGEVRATVHATRGGRPLRWRASDVRRRDGPHEQAGHRDRIHLPRAPGTLQGLGAQGSRATACRSSSRSASERRR